MRQKTCTIIRGIDVDSCLKNASSFGSNRFVSSFAFIIGTFFYCEYILILRPKFGGQASTGGERVPRISRARSNFAQFLPLDEMRD